MKLFLLDLKFSRPRKWSPRYVDLYHVQEISTLHFVLKEAHDRADRDGFVKRVKAYGEANFSYRLAFQRDEILLEIGYPLDRYEYVGEGEKEVDVAARLLEFKDMYERFLAARDALDTRSVLYNPTSG